MFLYAKVVLDNLADQCSDAEIEDEINNFPNGLDAAYVAYPPRTCFH